MCAIIIKLLPGVAQLVAHLTGGQGVVSSSLATRTNKKACNHYGYRLFSCVAGMSFPYGFPLPVRNISNELLQAVGACFSHLFRHMAIDIQREGRRCVTKVPLNGLDVISGLKRRNRVAVSQIMKAGFW